MNSASISTGDWKVSIESTSSTTSPTAFCSLDNARQFFAVDASGSTMGRIIKREQAFVEKLHVNHTDDHALTWGSYCGRPQQDFCRIRWEDCRGGTAPDVLLRNHEIINTITSSDVWYLLTDGEIPTSSVNGLSAAAIKAGILNVPVIFVITGRKASRPAELDISVGVTFFANASDVLILFSEPISDEIYVIAAKGCFACLAPSDGVETLPDLDSWDAVRKIKNEAELIQLCCEQGVRIQTAESRPMLVTGNIRLGADWEAVNPGTCLHLDSLFNAPLLSGDDIEQLLADTAWNALSVACKTRGRIQDLRAFLIRQKIEQITIRLEDISGAAAVVTQLSAPGIDLPTRDGLSQRLREAHATNRRHYEDAVEHNRQTSQQETVRRRNRLINAALESLSRLQYTTYTAESISRSSNRARRAALVTADDDFPMVNLDLNIASAFRGTCHLCCGEDEVMSIVIKRGANTAANTDNLALDFPLAAGRFKTNQDLVSSQCVCFQCSLAMSGSTVYHEDVAAVLPTLPYTGPNKPYMQEQMFFALTGGLRTGASGASQLLMTLLDGVLRTKEWAGAGCDDVPADREIVQRKAMLEWMLKNLLETTMCRETFNEQGDWVMYRQALAWAANDFRIHGVDSWAVGYPIAGFMQLLRFGQRLGAFDDQIIRNLRLAKLMHSVASAYLGLMLRADVSEASRKGPLLQLIYAKFNYDLVPCDLLGDESILSDIKVFWGHLGAFISADAEFLADWHDEEMARAMQRIQLIAFWLVYHQPAHIRAKGFFQTLRLSQPLSLSVLDVFGSAVASTVANRTLLSIFRGPACDQAINALHTGTSAFATPFGASVLKCCFANCAEPFMSVQELPSSESEWKESDCAKMREGRAAHCKRVFATSDEFGRVSQTGLPSYTADSQAPMSTHYNLHISIARAWARQSVEKRQHIAAMSGKPIVEFEDCVIETICAGRRGDVHNAIIREGIQLAMPSFLASIRDALKLAGRGGGDVALYEHDWSQNKIEAKAKHELRVMQMRNREEEAGR